jgi:hypothetical protein
MRYSYDPQFPFITISLRCMGRFLSPDPSGLAAANPANPQSFNLYGYVANNPLNSVDPSGLNTCTLEGVDVDCSTVQNNEGAVQCPENDCSLLNQNFSGKYGGSFSLQAGVNGFNWINNWNGEEIGDSGAEEAGFANFNDFLGLSDPGSSGAAHNNGEPPSSCLTANINAVNAVSNLHVNASNVVGQPFIYNGGLDVNFSVPGGSPSQLAVGRYPSSFINRVLGIGSSLHVPGRGGADPSTYGVDSNGNFTFTTHIDSAYSTWHTPIGALIHYFVDVRSSGAHRKPC